MTGIKQASGFLTVAFGFLLVLAVLGGLSGCASEECDNLTSTLPLAGFYNGSLPDEQIAIDSVQIIGKGVPGGASALSGYASGSLQAYLPFRVDADETTYLLFYRQAALQPFNLSDTITFQYKREPYFHSEACGVVYNYKIKNITTTHTFIDSVSVPGGIITNVASENIRIYFKVANR